MSSIEDTSSLESYTTVSYNGKPVRHLFCDGNCHIWHPHDVLVNSHRCPAGCLWCVTCVTFHQPGSLCKCIECERFRQEVKMCYEGLQKHLNMCYISRGDCIYCIRCQTQLQNY